MKKLLVSTILLVCALTVNVHAEDLYLGNYREKYATSVSLDIVNYIYDELNKVPYIGDGIYGIDLKISDNKLGDSFSYEKINYDKLNEYNAIIAIGKNNLNGNNVYYLQSNDEIKVDLEKIFECLYNRNFTGGTTSEKGYLKSTFVAKNGEKKEVATNIIIPSYVTRDNLKATISNLPNSFKDGYQPKDKDNNIISKYYNIYFDKNTVFFVNKIKGELTRTKFYSWKTWISLLYKTSGIYPNINIQVHSNIINDASSDLTTDILFSEKLAYKEKYDIYDDHLGKDDTKTVFVLNLNQSSENIDNKLNPLGVARSMAVAMTSISSYADGDYMMRAMLALNDLTQTSIYNDIKSKYARDVLNDAMVLLKFRQPLYKSNTNNDYTNTQDLKAAFVRDILYSDKLSLFVCKHNSNGRTISHKPNRKEELDIFTENEEETKTLSRILGLLDENSNEEQLIDADYTLAKFNKYNNDIENNITGFEDGHLSNILQNKILTIDSEGYLNKVQSYINYIYFQKLKEDVAFTSKVDLMSPLYVDGVGNIVTENNVLIVPAMSNNVLMGNEQNKFNNVMFYNTKCFADAMKTRTKISANVYQHLLNVYELKFEDYNNLNPYVDYVLTQHFGIKKVGNNYYLSLTDLQTTDDKGNKHIINRDWYNVNKPSICANALYTILNRPQKFLDASVPDINGNIVQKKILNEPNKMTLTTPDGNPMTMAKNYNSKACDITYLVLNGYKLNTLQSVTSNLLKDYEYSLPTVALLNITDIYSKNISGLFPSFLHNSANIFEIHIGNTELIDIYQIILVLLIWVGLLVIIIKVMISFSVDRALKIIFTYLLAVILIAGSTTAVGWIQYTIQNLLADDAQRTLALRSITESDKDFRVSATTKLSFADETARIKLEDRDVQIQDKIKSVINLREYKKWSEMYNEELDRNPLRNGGNALTFDLYSYYMDINRMTDAIGIRQIKGSDNKSTVALTYDENVSLSCAYFPILPMMQVFTYRMREYLSSRPTDSVSSTIDKRKSQKYDIEEMNNTYGLSIQYYLQTTELDSQVKTSYEKYKGCYDISGIAGLLKPYFTKGNERFNGNETSNTYYAFNGGYKDANGLIVKPSYSDEGTYNAFGLKFSQVTPDILDEFYVDNSQWIKGVLDPKNQEIVIDAIADANEAFRRSLAEVYQISATMKDRDIIFYCALNASLAFNRRLGNYGVAYNVNDFSNDLILSYAQFGRNRFLSSSGRTITRYMFENATNGLTAFTNLISIIMFDVLSLLKYILVILSILAFIYSVILNGVVKSNSAGIIGTVSMYALIHVISSLYLRVFSIIANIVNDVTKLSIISLIFIFILCYITLSIIKAIAENATSGGAGMFVKGVADGVADLALGATNEVRIFNNNYNNHIMSRYNNITQEKYMQQTQEVRNMNNVRRPVVVKEQNHNYQNVNKISVKSNAFTELGV